MKVLIVESEFLHQDTWVGNAVERLADALSQQNVTVIKSTSFDDGYAILSANEAIDCLMFSYQMEQPDEHLSVRQLIGKLHERQQNVPVFLLGDREKAAADDGLFPPIFARVNKAGTPVAGLLIVGVLMTIFQFSSMSPNAAKEFGLVSSVSVIFTLVPYLYTCAALLLLGHGHFGKARPLYLLITFVAFVYCIWAVIGSGAKEVMWSFVTLMVITALYALNYNRIHKNPYPLDAPVKQD